VYPLLILVVAFARKEGRIRHFGQKGPPVRTSLTDRMGKEALGQLRPSPGEGEGQLEQRKGEGVADPLENERKKKRKKKAIRPE